MRIKKSILLIWQLLVKTMENIKYGIADSYMRILKKKIIQRETKILSAEP